VGSLRWDIYSSDGACRIYGSDREADAVTDLWVVSGVSARDRGGVWGIVYAARGGESAAGEIGRGREGFQASSGTLEQWSAFPGAGSAGLFSVAPPGLDQFVRQETMACAIRVADSRRSFASCSVSFAPFGADHLPLDTHGLRRGLHSFAASRLLCQPHMISHI